MDIEVLYWHWLVVGLVLVVLEIFLPSFTVLWFGLGAMVVGIVQTMVPMSLPVQIVLWTVSSVAFAILWFKLIKPRMAASNRDDDALNSAIGQAGMVTKLPTEMTLGIMRFSTPVMDRDEWEFRCDMSVELGNRLHVVDFDGDTVIVTKHD
ncbi:NfeD family protein [Porticoccaceae bacterium]|jgi:membrane protein implicated in regulation of membrane protease activity|nr:NfeD family protein [Porticoccaceae bacterium]MDA8682725.1 NfeD family protein [Porticoccaceae bacterium]MDA8788469.1 NfeD family protein [Porticoccaceae bacterium]MDB2343316.1 NfeD family protein [Porticoccaceae bacterium]